MADLHPEIKLKLMKRWESRSGKAFIISFVLAAGMLIALRFFDIPEALKYCPAFGVFALGLYMVGKFQGLKEGINFDESAPDYAKIMKDIGY